MIRLEKMTESTRALAQLLEVAPEQLRFVGTMDEILAIAGGAIVPVLVWHHPDVNQDDTGNTAADASADATTNSSAADASAEVVGFFLLDKEYDREHEFANASDLGFRAFLIDVRHQGKGFGKAALKALPTFVQTRYPQFQRLVLTVNLNNTLARDLYLKSNFIDSNSHYLGGSAGPQHIFYLPLG
ncbi:GNAT family N-acetyltransferase [Shewanella sp. JM162201]|uniref:GNAT family N-acetyltransferase n=1 Tax=Shewanella jiangmenensis TaxID=2837387 RepID=A0ABS5V3F4_9GAMM|nr:GNAT family N-acetyltransferase [Shewanella jiangmenensis]MBT1444982.1 GNAT family N-acetyltransferase [Shewanella jiangmenensis]